MITLNNNPIDKIRFPDHTALLRCGETVDEILLRWDYESDEELFELICLARHLRSQKSVRKLSLLMPYLPNARMDRVKSKDEVFTLKYFCQIINSLDFDEVAVLDVHSSVGIALLDRAVSLSPQPYIERVLEIIRREHGDPVLYFPDEGACKRYISLFPQMPYCFGLKSRDWKSGKITSLEILSDRVDLKGRTLLMIDDICSYGGTLYYSAQALFEHGAGALYSYTTHTEMSLLDPKSKYLKLLRNGRVLRHFTTAGLYRGEAEFIEAFSLLPACRTR